MGEYLIRFHKIFKNSIGIDFSNKMLSIFRKRLGKSVPDKMKIMYGDARDIPLKDSSLDFIYSYCSLYHIPDVKKVIREVGRVLREDGITILELGNYWSLNTLVCEYNYKKYGWAKPYHISYSAMKSYIRNSGMEIIDHRCFQILPLWGTPIIPWTYFKKILSIKIGGKMIDEIISGIWPIRYFAFRHIIICKKGGKNVKKDKYSR